MIIIIRIHEVEFYRKTMVTSSSGIFEILLVFFTGPNYTACVK